MTTARFRRVSFVSLLVLLATFPLRGQHGAADGEWRAWGGDGGTSRYSALAQINRDNVRNLRVAWTWSSDGVGGAPEARSETTPLMANGRLFFTAGRDRAVVAADAGTGETLWQAVRGGRLQAARLLSAVGSTFGHQSRLPRQSAGRTVATRVTRP